MRTYLPAMTVVYRIGFLVGALVACYAALYPNLTLPEPSLTRGYTDKIYHVTVCMTLALLAMAGWRVRPIMYVLVIPVSVVAEIVQGLAPGRSVHVSDMLANLLGFCLACLIVRFVNRSRPCSQPRLRRLAQNQ